MALSYAEYKQMNAVSLSGAKALLETAAESNVQPAMMDLLEIPNAVMQALGLQDRMAEVYATKGFLGFMMFVQSYPEQFAADRAFWVECHTMGIQLLAAIVAGEEQGVIDVVMADPDVVMAKRFILNPSMIIKG